MRIDRVLLACIAVLVLCAPAAAQDEQTDQADQTNKTEDDAQAPQPAAELPPRFIPKEEIAPDSVISFPADI